MAYFPAFIRFDDKKILLIGGGNIALEKLEKLLDFTSEIKVIATRFNEETQSIIQTHQLSYEEKKYEERDIEGFDIVIAAVDDFDLQEEIFKQTRGKNILCNCVDLQKYCDFIFPSYIKRDDLTIAVSTSGASPAMAKQLRIFLSQLIPDSIGTFLEQMKHYRKTMPKGKERMQFLDKKAQEYIQTWGKKHEEKTD
ncbi:precorrin-2 dehydrogenase/sirohydrochlorin ferrochelatase family protein [Candidatus Marinarcus aquaticus]|uniref:precorrin-2 dehydrogenase n=1 Tax=Candidatus Marinarcus aquaticus TaxID=2044504 RepID=A0A4Q0XPX1_9BACT|nr:bifunctional precorrin-2 dehydrogenase/sirohydrochlorin ferrochelatase [Candidatus Marinarcus aquaticus]RXJ57608.1 siroheme synthase [Candidatus Marinarcus aquaticus]